MYLPDGRMLNALLLEAGLAQLFTIPPNVRHVDLFVRLQREARDAGRGIWSEQPLAQTGRPAVRIERVDLRGEEVVLVNEGQVAIDLSRWTLISVVGNQQFRCPPGTTLGPGQRLAVRSGPGAATGPGVLVCTKSNAWNDGGDALGRPVGRRAWEAAAQPWVLEYLMPAWEFTLVSRWARHAAEVAEWLFVPEGWVRERATTMRQCIAWLGETYGVSVKRE